MEQNFHPMKPKPSHSLPKQRAKRPKARVLYVQRDEGPHPAFAQSCRIWNIPSAVIPTRTQQQARQLVRWHNKTYAQKVEAVAYLLWAYKSYLSARWKWKRMTASDKDYYRGFAIAILNLLGESPDPEN